MPSPSFTLFQNLRKRIHALVRKQKQIHKERNGYSAEQLEAIAKATAAPTGFNSWAPEKEGAAICGTVVGSKIVKGPNGPFISLDIEEPQGLIEVPASTVLTRELERLGILTGVKRDKANKITHPGECATGDNIAIVFRGFVKGKRGKPARLFTVQKVK